MRSSILSAISLIASCASAYENSSPFYLSSTSTFKISPINDLSLASSVQSSISGPLSQCPTKNYIIISQPGISATDLAHVRISSLGRDTAAETKTIFTVRDVIGTIDTSAIESHLRSVCDIQSIHNLDASTDLIPELDDANKSNTIVHIDFSTLSEKLTNDDRRAVIQHHDFYLSIVTKNYFDGKDFTVIYTSTSREAARIDAQATQDQEYMMEDDVPANVMHQDLKRGLGANFAKKNGSSHGNQTIVDGPLFDKYQFLTPGIFMGGIVFLLLLMILYVGFSALMSLQVTYGAFDKEQGQLAGKKSQ